MVVFHVMMRVFMCAPITGRYDRIENQSNALFLRFLCSSDVFSVIPTVKTQSMASQRF